VDAASHWEKIYTAKAPDSLSWYRPHLETSLAWIEHAAVDRSASILDVGGGASTLVDDLLLRGFTRVTVLDVSAVALEVSKRRLGQAAESVRWISGDVTDAALQPGEYDLWHDRAAFHFLITPERVSAYVRQVIRALKPGGHVIMGTFGPEGPAKCSGLDVMRYDRQSLLAEFGERFQLLESSTELHQTPAGVTQQFAYSLLQFR
jgi:SAM-dependent methyltransferase